MTKHKDKKNVVRQRMEKTGESYTTALRHVDAHAHSGGAPLPSGGAGVASLMRPCLDCGEIFRSTGGENIYCDDCMDAFADDD